MARTLHISWLLSIAMTCACIVPPYAEPIEGENRGPVIIRPLPGTTETVYTSEPPPYADKELDIDVRDPDLDEDLHLRFFVNFEYDNVVPVNVPTIPAGATTPDGTRRWGVKISGLCDTVLDSLGAHILEAYVSDGDGFAEETGRQVKEGALRDVVSWRIECEPPLPLAGDGGT